MTIKITKKIINEILTIKSKKLRIFLLKFIHILKKIMSLKILIVSSLYLNWLSR